MTSTTGFSDPTGSAGRTSTPAVGDLSVVGRSDGWHLQRFDGEEWSSVGVYADEATAVEIRQIAETDPSGHYDGATPDRAVLVDPFVLRGIL